MGEARRAIRAGAAFREVPLPSLAIDVDEPGDIEALLRSGGAGPETRALLAELQEKRAR